MGFLTQPEYKPETDNPAKYNALRMQVFAGVFIAYAGFYLVRKNFSMAIPFLSQFLPLIGFCTYLLGTAILANTVLGFVAQRFGWGANFVVVLLGCVAAVLFLVSMRKAEKNVMNQTTD